MVDDELSLAEPLTDQRPNPDTAIRPLIPLFATSALTAALAACGGGGGATATPPIQSTPSPGPQPTPAPPPTSPTPQQASRFLLQSQFSASDAELTAVQSAGYAGWLDQQFNAAPSTTGWDWLLSKGYGDTSFTNNSFPTDYMIWNQLIASPGAVRKRVALALSEIMVASANGVNLPWRFFAMAAYWDTLVANAFGNYRALLEAITLNAAMGVYLNTRGNQKEDAATGRQPDENYAREVLQLFSIGLYELNQDGTNKLVNGQPVETYDQSTVSNLARVFTGYNFDTIGSVANDPQYLRKPMVVTASMHSNLAATFLGVTVASNTAPAVALKTALDTIANHPNVAPFISKQLIQRLVTSNPSPAYVGRVAAVFNNNGASARGDLKAVVRAVLLDDEARSATGLTAPTWGKLREPILRFVQWARTFKATSGADTWRISDLSSDATRLGQSPLRSASVFNFFRPGYVPPNTALATAALVAPEFQITNESSVAGYVNFMQNTVRNGFADVSANYAAELALVADAAALVERLNLLLTAGQLSAANVETIRSAVASIAVTTTAGQLNRVQAAIWLVMAAPQYLVQK